MTRKNRNQNNTNNLAVRAVSQPLPRNVKLALRSMRKQDNKTSVLVRGPVDPPPIINDVVVEKVVEVVPTTSTSLSITYSVLYKLLDPGATPFFTSMRVIKICTWAPVNTGSSTKASLSINYDGAFFTDQNSGIGKGGSVHVRLPEFVRETWVSTGSTNGIASVAWVGAFFPVIQATIQVRANQSADT